ncbi:hypothetical protein B7R22_17205 [Subtercola boreus]|uniref:IPT/TIG domain-containing protein n=1 Tax=Subtercola boreus TaxID=120213 RepID=A0A3E0VQK5_9MICO|nr:IPT/TIG domain-containing protein [Subtercola boreus]RFA12166.1 hypothetical protein B7R22_17205 [Subtercola boreus]
MSDTSIFDATVPTDGTLANAHERILRMKRAGVFENITGDINNLKPVPSGITQARENYGQKGRTASRKQGDNWVVTFDVEVVRDSTGEIAQDWLIALLGIANANGVANLNDFQWFDALSPSVPAHQGSFSVHAEDTSVGFADKASYSFTLTSDGVVDDITSPIAGTGAPIIESVVGSPNPAATGKNVVVRGYNLGAITAATIGGTAATSITPIDGRTVVLEVPVGAAGTAQVLLTNALGVSAGFPYVRGA